MKIFVTGATGYIGSAVVDAFVKAGHDVTGMIHSEDKVHKVEAMGGTPLPGDIWDAATYETFARQHDVLIHCALDYAEDPVGSDARAIETLLRATGGYGALPEQMLIYTSGCWILGNTGDTPADEDASTDHPADIANWRPVHEELVLSATTKRAPTTVIRPGMVYGGSAGLISEFFSTARDSGAAVHVGDGQNRWSSVHREDLARLYVLLAEKRLEGVFHAVDDNPSPVAEMARAASRAAGAGGTIRSVPVEEARTEMGPMVDALILDQAITSRRTGEIGWHPDRSSFIECAEQAFVEWEDASAP